MQNPRTELKSCKLKFQPENQRHFHQNPISQLHCLVKNDVRNSLIFITYTHMERAVFLKASQKRTLHFYPGWEEGSLTNSKYKEKI